MSNTTYSTTQSAEKTHVADRRISTETKASVKTSELIVLVAGVIAVLVAAQVSDEFGAQDAWFYVTLMAVGYLVSRGLAKSGSRDFYDDDTRTTR
ncbi:hypothetical protein ISU07_21625 [Nocardioides islandensis]|jgi:hypothetical protein|uniref:Uncharacterized protein n=1 Tax=Nocardioides islandensis TaxID=433663 RepID=A0A930VJ74_9ACTN|nr:hypothetical protein [Nocardioides islandensis]MBF4765740.1 hypothetical protein [Nocardioides islandensis]